MSSEVLRRAVEPFFTTLHRSEADGLGLSFVYGFVTHSGGHLQLASQPQVGTRVTLRFPTTGGDVISEITNSESDSPPVLVVEDEVAILQTLSLALETAGYRVLTATDAMQAEELLARHPIAALVSDIILKGSVDGWQLARRAAQRFPDLPIILMSGFVGWAPPQSPLPDHWSFLAKPFSPVKLIELLASRVPTRR